jgi:hypothetical protein
MEQTHTAVGMMCTVIFFPSPWWLKYLSICRQHDVDTMAILTNRLNFRNLDLVKL